MGMDRRKFLKSAALSGIAVRRMVSGGVPRILMYSSRQGPRASADFSPPPYGYDSEATRITNASFQRWWDSEAGAFRTSVASAETVPVDASAPGRAPHDHGYLFRPSLLGLHSLIEGEKSHPGRYTARIWAVYSGLEQFFNEKLHAYNSRMASPENRDSDYDDNAWAVTVLVEASLITVATDSVHSKMYLSRAEDIMDNYVRHGWDASDAPGGVRRGTERERPGSWDRTTSATAGAALAALMLARAGKNVAANTQWGQDLLAWLRAHLLDKADNLYYEGLQSPTWAVMESKWTCNTGVPMRAYVEHYRLTRSKDSLMHATRLAQAALDHNRRLYDGSASNPNQRCFHDSSFFVHFLIDGLLHVRQVTTNTALAAAILAEAKREANYAYTYIRDDSDSFYWRNWRLWRIGAKQTASWERMTGQPTQPDLDRSEMSADGSQYVKTLLANAAIARMYWLMTRF